MQVAVPDLECPYAMHLQAQDNIIELNKSRLRALEELKAARAKIADLGELRCEPCGRTAGLKFL
jgi:hypothetical protein